MCHKSSTMLFQVLLGFFLWHLSQTLLTFNSLSFPHSTTHSSPHSDLLLRHAFPLLSHLPTGTSEGPEVDLPGSPAGTWLSQGVWESQLGNPTPTQPNPPSTKATAPSLDPGKDEIRVHRGEVLIQEHGILPARCSGWRFCFYSFFGSLWIRFVCKGRFFLFGVGQGPFESFVLWLFF